MPINRIDQMSRLLEALKVSRTAESPKVKKVAKRQSNPEGSPRDALQKDDWSKLRSEINQSLLNVDLDKRQELVDVSTKVIQSILRFQWGQSVLQEPQFVDMLERMQRKIENNTELQKKMTHLLKEFKKD